MSFGNCGSSRHELEAAQFQKREANSYYAEISKHKLDEQGDLIDQIIEHAFGTLDAQHLDLRVVDTIRTIRCAA
jgi:hypothetical protein